MKAMSPKTMESWLRVWVNYYGVLVSVIKLIYGTVNSNSVWYENDPFILATMAKQVFYLDDPAIVPDTEDIRVNDQHVPAIIGYIPITSSEVNSLQRNLNHDDDGFIDDEYIEDDEYSDQIEEVDNSDDSDYDEYD
ncbi:hypothetical protein ACLB2K_026490 [Fragaria x ananassa]